MIVLLGDIHFRSKEPFYSASKAFCDWFTSQSFNNPDNTLIQLGDVLHEAKSNGAVNYLMMDLFFRKMNFGAIYVLQGNHDVSKREGSGLYPLRVIDNLKVVDFPGVIGIDDINVLFLPYYYPYTNDLRPMIEEYQDLDLDGLSWDWIMTHVSDETQLINKDHIDLSYIKGNRISGHIHIPSEHYIGSAYPTRFDEKGKDNWIAFIEDNRIRRERVPNFLDYQTLKYGETMPETESMYTIWDIDEAPSRDAVYKMYGKYTYIRNIRKKKAKSGPSKRKPAKEQKTLMGYLSDFFTTNNIEPEVRGIVTEKIRSRA